MTILLVAGDVSGDIHGASLIRSLKSQCPGLSVAAAGGQAMRQAADHFVADLVSLSVSGFWEPLTQIWKLRRIFHDTIRPWVERSQLIVPIDYYGFNIHVCRLAKSLGRQIFYFISPQVWASRSYRAQELARCGATMLTIFPFEESFYRNQGVSAHFVGHPLLDHLPPAEERLFPHAGTWNLGLLPGSRRDEIRRHLPLLLESAARIWQEWPEAHFHLFLSPQADESLYKQAQNAAFPLSFVKESDYNQRKSLDLALSCSGTATLENALLGIPMAVIYKTSWPTYAIARLIVQVKAISIVNILAGKMLVPEFIQHQAAAGHLAQTVLQWKNQPERLQKIRHQLLALRQSLGSPGACDRAAKIILESLSTHEQRQKAIAVS